MNPKKNSMECNIKTFGDLSKYFIGMKFPVTKQEIISWAKSHGASDDIIQTLDLFPDDKSFESMTNIEEEFSQAEFLREPKVRAQHMGEV